MRLPLTASDTLPRFSFRLSLSQKEIHREMKVFFAFRESKIISTDMVRGQYFIFGAPRPSKSGLMNRHIVKHSDTCRQSPDNKQTNRETYRENIYR